LPSEPTGGCWLLIGRKGSGKTTLVLKLLRGPLRKIFNEIWIVSPTAHLQPAFSELHPEGIKLFKSELTPKVLKKIIKHRNAKPEVHVLVVLDDCGKISPSQELCQIFYLSRHINTAVICLCQKITSCPTEVRSQCDFFVSFSNTAKREKEALFREIGQGDFKEFVSEFEQATNSVPYGTYVCSMQNGRPFYFKNCF
jgi:GTPase SAR1 family protein